MLPYLNIFCTSLMKLNHTVITVKFDKDFIYISIKIQICFFVSWSVALFLAVKCGDMYTTNFTPDQERCDIYVYTTP